MFLISGEKTTIVSFLSTGVNKQSILIELSKNTKKQYSYLLSQNVQHPVRGRLPFRGLYEGKVQENRPRPSDVKID